MQARLLCVERLLLRVLEKLQQRPLRVAVETQTDPVSIRTVSTGEVACQTEQGEEVGLGAREVREQLKWYEDAW